VSTRIVRGTYVDGAGNPQRGVLTFRVDQPLIAALEEWGVVPTPVQATLNASGAFSITLMASSDIDLFPSGFRYLVQERFLNGYVRTYSVEVPADADPLDLPTASQYDPGDTGLAVVRSVNGRTGIVSITAADLAVIPLSQKGAALGVPSLDSTGKIPVSQLPAGTSGVTTVDGRSGVVTLTDLYAALGHSHAYPVTSVNGDTGVVVLGAADVGAVSTALLAASSGVATLDSTGKLMGSQVPAVALTTVFDVVSQAAMLALSGAQPGDLARRTDLSKTFVLTANDYAVLANWKELLTPADAVASVNGQTGIVSLDPEDVDAVALDAVGAPGGVAELDGGGLVPVAQIPALPASKIASGLVDFLRLPTGTTSTTVAIGDHVHGYIPTSQRGAASGVASLDASTLVPVAQIPGLAAAKIVSGALDIARVPTGTSGTTVALGNHDHSAAYVAQASVSAASGVAPLDSGSRVPLANLPQFLMRGVTLAEAAALPAGMPQGTMVLRYTEDAGVWTSVVLEGVYDGTQVVSVTLGE
jgi:hypothetical protein